MKLLINILMCVSFTALASDTNQHDAVANEFFHLYHSEPNASIGIQTQDGRFGATTFNVEADPAKLCELFISVAPDINYVIVTWANGHYKYRACD
jgi:hypothetical protein